MNRAGLNGERAGAMCGSQMIQAAPAPVARCSPEASRFAAPPVQADAAGRVRRVGVEVEFAGLTAGAAARALRSALGGAVETLDPHAFRVRGTKLGDLAVELDLRYAHPGRRDPTLPIRPGRHLASALGWLLHGIVPRELITGPLPLPRLADIDLAVAALRAAGARGRGASLWGSFGLHLNVELPRLDAATLVSYLKAYLLLEPALRRAVARRRWRPFLAAPFPTAYARQVADLDYWPDLATLADDYLAANPTRNRGLDLLPVLLHLDEARVRAVLPHAKIGARPVLHHRLPQAYVSEPGWSVAGDWNRWVAVERLAADLGQLAALARTFLDFHGSPSAWAALVGPRLVSPALEVPA